MSMLRSMLPKDRVQASTSFCPSSLPAAAVCARRLWLRAAPRSHSAARAVHDLTLRTKDSGIRGYIL